MTGVIASVGPGDLVLLRLPGAAWRALPVLAVCGVGTAGVTTLAVWVTAWMPVLAMSLAAVLVSPLFAWAVDAVHRQLFAERTHVPRGRRALAAGIGCVVPAMFATWSTLAAGLAEATQSSPLQVLAVAALVAAAVCAAVAVVAIPLADVRDDAALRSIVAISFVAVARRPLGAIAALGCAAAVVWLGLTWFAGLLVLAAPVLIVLMVGAAWTTAVAAGVDLPMLPLIRPRHRPTNGEEE